MFRRNEGQNKVYVTSTLCKDSSLFVFCVSTFSVNIEALTLILYKYLRSRGPTDKVNPAKDTEIQSSETIAPS